MKRHITAAVVLAVVAAAVPAIAQEQRFSGDGLSMVVKTEDKATGSVTGELTRGDKTFRFSARIQEDNSPNALVGTFVAGGETFDFVCRHDRKTGNITFITGSRTYTLRAEQPRPAVDNPLNEGAINPLNEASDRPAANNPLNVDAESGQPAPHPAPNRDASSQQTLRLKLVRFNDVTMGGVPSHVMLIPEDWNATGQISWGPAEDPFPQSNVRVEGPDGSAIIFVPSANFAYLETVPMPGMLTIEPRGVPAPESLGEFVVETVRRRGKVQNVRLLEDKRDLAAEAKLGAQPLHGGANRDVKQQLHRITYTYDQDGVPFKECLSVLYARYPDSVVQNMRNEAWSLFTFNSIAAPAANFDQRKNLLYQIAATYRPLPKWWVQYFEVRQEIINRRHQDAMAAIKARAEFYNSMSEMQYSTFRKNMAAMDKAQKDRIDAIYERQDYRDVDGSNVNLTFHYNHVYSDGEGRYILTNDPLLEPKSGSFTEIEPIR